MIPSPGTDGCALDSRRILLSEVKYYSETHWSEHFLGFRPYLVAEIFELSIVKSCCIFDSPCVEGGLPALLNFICGKLLVEVFGSFSLVNIHCIPSSQTCAVEFVSDETVHNESDFRSEWNDEERKRLRETSWCGFVLA